MKFMADLMCNFIRQRAETDAGQGHALSVFIKFFRFQLGVAGIIRNYLPGNLSGSGSSGPLIVIDFITTGVTGRSFAPVLTEAISSTTSMPSMTLPKAA